jgi:hypothetical protein
MLAAASAAVVGVLWISGAVMQGRLGVGAALGIEALGALIVATAIAAGIQ